MPTSCTYKNYQASLITIFNFDRSTALLASYSLLNSYQLDRI